MSFRKIIVLMLLAMIGLIAFQWYWIEKAIAEKKEQFNRDVNDALQATVRKIEKQEIIFLANQQVKVQEQRRLLAIAQPTPRKSRLSNPQKTTAIVVKTERQTLDLDPELSIAPVDIFMQENVFEIPEKQMIFIKETIEEQNLVWDDKNTEDLKETINREIILLNKKHENKKNIHIKFDPKEPFTENYVNEMYVDSLNNVINLARKSENRIEVRRKKTENSFFAPYVQTL